MTNKIKSFIVLSPSRKILIAQTLGLSFYTYLLFTFFKKHARFGQKAQAAIKQFPNKKTDDIAWAIQAVSRYIAWKNVCRHQAYQAKTLCNWYKIPCLIFIGFKKNEITNSIEAHAWTIAGDKMITGLCDPKEYTVQSVYRNKWQ
jgi:hypothetical protein